MTSSISSSSSSARRHLVGLVLAVLTLGLALEFTLRLGHDFGRNGPDRIQLLRDHANPRIGYAVGAPWAPREYTTTMHLNREGYRAPDFGPRPGRPRRLALLGDSYTVAAQVAQDQTLWARAESLLSDTQVLPLAHAGSFLPDQLRALREDVPRLFGTAGEYPSLDAVIVTVRLWGLLHEATDAPAGSWRVEFKRPISRRLRRLALRAVPSRSHALSLVASRADAWLRTDARRLDAPLTAQRLADAVPHMREEIVRPLVEEAHRLGLPLAFVYLPSAAEVDGSAPALHQAARDSICSLLEESSAVFVDATPWFQGDASRFLAYDRHPNARGHAAMAQALAEADRRLRERGQP
jgi:hypothetical protein